MELRILIRSTLKPALTTAAILLAACGGGQPEQTFTPTATGQAALTVTGTATSTAQPTEAPATLLLETYGPVNESVIIGQSVEVNGRTVIDAILTVNGDLVDIDRNGGFSTTVPLSEGPNLIEVVASDLDGNVSVDLLTVIRAA